MTEFDEETWNEIYFIIMDKVGKYADVNISQAALAAEEATIQIRELIEG